MAGSGEDAALGLARIGARTLPSASPGARSLLLPGGGLLVALAGLRALGELPRHPVLFPLLVAAAWVCYATATWLVLRRRGPDSRALLGTILVVGLGGRLLLLASTWMPSDSFNWPSCGIPS